jgi:hypothetical protein
VTSAAREYAQQWFARFSRLAALTADDRDAVEDLLERFSDDIELEPRATRTVWVALPNRIKNSPELARQEMESAQTAHHFQGRARRRCGWGRSRIRSLNYATRSLWGLT